MPSLSSASSTSHSPVSHTALVPISLTSPPMRKLGRSPASIRISASIDVVVVLPWVPDTATQRRQAGDGGQRLGPAQHRQPPPASLGHLGIRIGDGGRHRHDLGLADVGGVVAHEHLHPAGGQALERGRGLQVAAGDDVAHGGEHRRDGAHARTARPHHVHASGRAGRGPRRSPGRRQPGRTQGHAPPVLRDAGCGRGRGPAPPPPSAASGRPTRAGRGAHGARGARGRRPGRRSRRPGGPRRTAASAMTTGRPGALEDAGVGALVVTGRAGQGHEHGGHPHHGQLGHGVGPRPRRPRCRRPGRRAPSGPRRAPGRSTGASCRRPTAPAAPASAAHGAVASAHHVVQRHVGASPPTARPASMTASLSRRAPERPAHDRHHQAVAREARARRAAAARAAASGWAAATMASRTGAPVTTARGRAVPSKATAAARAKRPTRRLAAPGTASTFTSTTGHPQHGRRQRRGHAGVPAHGHHHRRAAAHHDDERRPRRRPPVPPTAPTLASARPGVETPGDAPARGAASRARPRPPGARRRGRGGPPPARRRRAPSLRRGPGPRPAAGTRWPPVPPPATSA